MKGTRALALILLAVLTNAAFARPARAGEANLANGKEQYQTHCASCHGKEGKGDGPDAEDLDPKPADHTNGKAMNRLRNNYLFTLIKNGGKAVGKSDQMPGWGNVLSEKDINDVIAFVRSLAKPPYRGR